MQKEPMTTTETTLPEIKRRKRKVPETVHGMTNISYGSLHELYIKECRKKNLAEETITGYHYAGIYFLDFAGHNLMCEDVTQDLINEYYLYLQEPLYATYSTVEPEFWRELAEQNQYDFKRSNAKGKCIEVRELVVALPESFREYDRELLLQLFAEHLRSTYGLQCTAALHHNKKKTNYHIHLIYSERKVLEKKEIKRVSRNMFYDEKGKRVRTKKEILDGKGNVRQGCYIISKGEIYEMSFFDSKEKIFKKIHF